MAQLFASARALEVLPMQQRPTPRHGGNARERILRLCGLSRFEAPVEIFSPTVKRNLLRQHSLSHPTHLTDTKPGGQRVLRSMAPGYANHDDTLRRASASQRRGIAALSDRRVEAWAIKSDSPLFLTFGETLLVQKNPRKASDGMRIVDSTCYVSAKRGDASEIQAHHVTVLNSGRPNVDNLLAPLTRKANKLVSALVFVNAVDDDFGFLLHLRGNKLALCCDWMDNVRAGRIEPPVLVEETRTAGCDALWRSFEPGNEHHDFLERVSDDDELLVEAGLADGGEYYKFNQQFLQSMPFVYPGTVLEWKVIEPSSSAFIAE